MTALKKIALFLLLCSCSHTPQRTPNDVKSDPNIYTVEELTTLPSEISKKHKVLFDSIASGIEEQYAPDVWNVEVWLNHYRRTDPDLFNSIISSKLDSAEDIFTHIRKAANHKLNDKNLIGAIETYTYSSNDINGALWKIKDFPINKPMDASDIDALAKKLGLEKSKVQNAANLVSAIKKLTPSKAQEPWVLFRGTAYKINFLYLIVQQQLAGKPMVLPHYGFGSYSADSAVAHRFTLGDIVADNHIDQVMEALKDPDKESAKAKIKKIDPSYQWDKTTVATFIVRLTNKSMSTLLDSWSSARGELEVIQPPENISVASYFSLSDHCTTHKGEAVPYDPTNRNDIIQTVSETGLLVLVTHDAGSSQRVDFTKSDMSSFCEERAYIRPSM